MCFPLPDTYPARAPRSAALSCCCSPSPLELTERLEDMVHGGPLLGLRSAAPEAQAQPAAGTEASCCQAQPHRAGGQAAAALAHPQTNDSSCAGPGSTRLCPALPTPSENRTRVWDQWRNPKGAEAAPAVCPDEEPPVWPFEEASGVRASGKAPTPAVWVIPVGSEVELG